MEEEVCEVVGPKGKHDADRSAVRHGHESGEVTLGGRRVAVKRPRARSADGGEEIALSTYAHFADRDPLCCVVALGITTDGVELPLGLWQGSTENKTVATALLADLIERGLDTEQGVLVVIDGSKALRAAVRAVLGERTPVQRCIRHKERNVLEHLAERARPRDRARARRSPRRQPSPRERGGRHRSRRVTITPGPPS